MWWHLPAPCWLHVGEGCPCEQRSRPMPWTRIPCDQHREHFHSSTNSSMKFRHFKITLINSNTPTQISSEGFWLPRNCHYYPPLTTESFKNKTQLTNQDETRIDISFHLAVSEYECCATFTQKFKQREWSPVKNEKDRLCEDSKSKKKCLQLFRIKAC